MSKRKYILVPILACSLGFPYNAQSASMAANRVDRTLDFVKRDSLLRCITLAKEIAADSPDDDTFQTFLEFIVDRGLIGYSHLANYAGVDRTIISRWINGRNFPSRAVKEIVLIKIAERFEEDVALISRKWGRSMVSEDCGRLLRAERE